MGNGIDLFLSPVLNMMTPSEAKLAAPVRGLERPYLRAPQLWNKLTMSAIFISAYILIISMGLEDKRSNVMLPAVH